MRALALALACLALAVAGCGDDESGSSSGSAAPADSTQYRAQVKAIVDGVSAKRDVALNASDDVSPGATMALSEAYGAAADRLGKLSVPDQAKDVNERLIDNFEKAQKRTSQLS